MAFFFGKINLLELSTIGTRMSSLNSHNAKLCITLYVVGGWKYIHRRYHELQI